MFDAIHHVKALADNGRTIHWIWETFGHSKAVGAVGEGKVLHLLEIGMFAEPVVPAVATLNCATDAGSLSSTISIRIRTLCVAALAKCVSLPCG